MPDNILVESEYVAWAEVVAWLVKTKAVTLEDCNATKENPKTDGQKLFAVIKLWGDALAKLHQSKNKVEVPSWKK